MESVSPDRSSWMSVMAVSLKVAVMVISLMPLAVAV